MQAYNVYRDLEVSPIFSVPGKEVTVYYVNEYVRV